VEQGIERHRAAELGAAEAQSGTLLSDAMDRNERYAERMRRRVQDLDGERERLMAELRRQTRTLAGPTKRLGPPPGSTA
jgi:hypothetical protein